MAIFEHRMDNKQTTFVLYMAIGLTGVAIDLVLFVMLTRIFGLNELFANTISISAGITNNFFLNAFFNFKKTDSLFKRYLSFFAVGIVGIGISNLFLWFFNDVLAEQVQYALSLIIPSLAAYRLEFVKAVSVIVIAIVQFFLNKKITFTD